MLRDQLIAHLTLLGCVPYSGNLNGVDLLPGRDVVYHPAFGFLYLWAGRLKISKVAIGELRPIAWSAVAAPLLERLAAFLNTDWDGTDHG